MQLASTVLSAFITWISFIPIMASVASIKIPIPPPKYPPYTEITSCAKEIPTSTGTESRTFSNIGAVACPSSPNVGAVACPCPRSLALIGPLKVNNKVAIKRRYGTKRTKIPGGVNNNNNAPRTPPSRLVQINKTSKIRSCTASSRRYAPTLATAPGHNATLLVALAGMAGKPVKTRAGKQIKLPPPATELSVPPSTAAQNRISPCRKVIKKCMRKNLSIQARRQNVRQESVYDAEQAIP